MTAPLLFPVGHYLGATYPADGGALQNQVVRVGWRLRKLDRPDSFAVWALAHGVPEGDGAAPWTRAAAEGAARATGTRDVPTIMDDLAERDLVVEVEPGLDAREFAQLYRMRSLLTGLGELLEEPNRYGIGFAGQPVARVDSFTYEFWKWAPACDSIRHACEIFARADGNDVDRTIDRALHSAQVLIAHGAAYLDEAREGWGDLDDAPTGTDD